MDLGTWNTSLGPLLGDSDRPGGVYRPDLLVQLVQLLIGEDLVPVPPGESQLVQQPSDLSGLGLILLSQGLK